MQNTVIDILRKTDYIDGWLINQKDTHSGELFFIKKELQMNRKKDVSHLAVTVYKNFEEDGKKFTGSADTDISPSMNKDEIADKIEKAAFAASFVKNPEFKLTKPTSGSITQLTSSFSDGNISEFLPQIAGAIYECDNHANGKVNSCEIFLEKIVTTVANSEGINESYTSFRGEIELVVDWNEGGEEVEVIEDYTFSDFDRSKIVSMVDKAFEKAKNRAVATPISALGDIAIILTGESARELLSFYIGKASSQMVYKKYSSSKIGDKVQGEEVKGDKVNVKMLPEIPFSVQSKYIDSDGVKLKELTLYENGVLKSYVGDSKHCQYLGIEPTGRIPNAVFAPGKTPKKELISGECLEVISFSAFGIDPITGDFGGEIRLAYHHDGGKTTPVTGGSVTGNITQVHNDMLFSKETEIIENYECPSAIKIAGARLSG